jgi:hypothetical protein
VGAVRGREGPEGVRGGRPGGNPEDHKNSKEESVDEQVIINGKEVEGSGSIDRDRAVSEVSSGIAALAEEAGRIEVRDPAGQEAAVGALGRIKQARSVIEDRRKAFTGPLNAVLKAWNERARAILAPLDAPEQGLRRKLADHQRALDRKRAEEQAAALKAQQDKEAEIERLAAKQAALKTDKAKDRVAQQIADVQAEPEPMPVARVETTLRDAGGGKAAMRKVWKFEVVDAGAVERQFLKIDEAAIRDAVRQGVRKISGVRVYEDYATAVY